MSPSSKPPTPLHSDPMLQPTGVKGISVPLVLRYLKATPEVGKLAVRKAWLEGKRARQEPLSRVEIRRLIFAVRQAQGVKALQRTRTFLEKPTSADRAAGSAPKASPHSPEPDKTR